MYGSLLNDFYQKYLYNVFIDRSSRTIIKQPFELHVSKPGRGKFIEPITKETGDRMLYLSELTDLTRSGKNSVDALALVGRSSQSAIARHSRHPLQLHRCHLRRHWQRRKKRIDPR
jgi:hypothetical protein